MFYCARFDRDPNLTFQMFFYDESPQTTPLTLKGETGVMIQLESPYSLQRAINVGWKDITEEMNALQNTRKIDIPDKSTAIGDRNADDVILVDGATKASPKKKTTRKKRR